MKNEINNQIQIGQNLDDKIGQKNFLETTLGKTINLGVDIGIRALLPDFIEEQIIDLKNNLIEYGLKDGIKKSIDDAIDLGKSAVGILTGNFENISQAQNAIKKGGIINNVSNLLDDIINRLNKNGKINSVICKTIKQGKNSILNNIEKNIENTFNNQLKSLSYTEKCINNWQECFNNKDFNGMEKEIKKLEKQIHYLIPIENTINQFKKIQNVHNLIKNNGHNFNLSNEELELSEKLK